MCLPKSLLYLFGAVTAHMEDGKETVPEFDIKSIALPLAFGLLIFASTLAWSYFLATAPRSELGMKTVIDTISSQGLVNGALELLGKVFSVRFSLFAIIFPATLALIAILPFYYARAKAYAISFCSCALALLALIVLFGFSKLGIINATFFGLGIVAMLEMCRLKKEEFKKFITFRSVASSCRIGLLIVSIGVLLTSAITAYKENDANTKQIGDDLIGVALRQDGRQSALTDKIADIVVQSQKQSITLISSTPQFEKLREKTDPDVQLYVATVDKTKEGINSPEMKQKILDELNKQVETAGGGAGAQLVTADVLRKQSPIMDLIFRYYWALAAFGIWSTFLAFANILVANLAGAYAAAIRAAAGQTKNFWKLFSAEK